MSYKSKQSSLSKHYKEKRVSLVQDIKTDFPTVISLMNIELHRLRMSTLEGWSRGWFLHGSYQTEETTERIMLML